MSKEQSQEELDRIKQDIIRGLVSQGYVIDSQTRKEIERLPKEKMDLLGASLDKGYGTRGLVEKFETELLPESPRLTARLTVLKAIKNMKKSGVNVSESQAKMIVDKLSPALEKLDPEYIKQNSAVMVNQIQKAVTERSMVTSSVLGGLYIRERNLDKIANELSGIHLGASDQFQITKINEAIYGLKPEAMVDRLSKLDIEQAKAKKYDIDNMSPEVLKGIRRENRELFDRTVFKREESSKVSTELGASGVVDKVIDKLVKSGVKLDNNQQGDLRVKLKRKLEPALSKLEPEYLQTNGDQIASEIQKKLFEDRSIGYRWGVTNFSVSDKSLDNVSKGIHSNHQKGSDILEGRIVEEGINKVKSQGSQQGQTELETRLEAFGVEKAKADVHKYTTTEMTTEALLKMRKENPVKFDKEVLKVEKGKTADKPIVTSKQEEALKKGAKRIEKEIAAEEAVTQLKENLKSIKAPPPLISKTPKFMESQKVFAESQTKLSQEQQERRLKPTPTPQTKIEHGRKASRGGDFYIP